MKKLVLLVFACTTLFAQAQTNVYFKISHKLAGQPFAFQAPNVNNLNNNFTVTRMQYYVSNIAIIHDGGTVTPATGVYVLANAADSTLQLLGNFNVTNLEAVRFSIGVDDIANHSDPASYATSHPLAPKSPAMHWGWAAGYRFVAMEGKSGTNLNFTYEIHALEDINYHTQTIATSGIASGSDLTIALDADYTKAIFDVNVSNGEVNHGSTGSAASLLYNFAWRVFKSSEGNAALAIDEENTTQELVILPNPSRGVDFITLQNLTENSTIILTDVLGKTHKTTLLGNQLFVGDLANGLYVILVESPKGLVRTHKLLIAN